MSLTLGCQVVYDVPGLLPATFDDGTEWVSGHGSKSRCNRASRRRPSWREAQQTAAAGAGRPASAIGGSPSLSSASSSMSLSVVGAVAVRAAASGARSCNGE